MGKSDCICVLRGWGCNHHSSKPYKHSCQAIQTLVPSHTNTHAKPYKHSCQAIQTSPKKEITHDNHTGGYPVCSVRQPSMLYQASKYPSWQLWRASHQHNLEQQAVGSSQWGRAKQTSHRVTLMNHGDRMIILGSTHLIHPHGAVRDEPHEQHVARKRVLRSVVAVRKGVASANRNV